MATIYTEGQALQYEVVWRVLTKHKTPRTAAIEELRTDPLTAGRRWSLPALAMLVSSPEYQAWARDWEGVIAATVKLGMRGRREAAEKAANWKPPPPLPKEESVPGPGLLDDLL
jgi:hypothetical protein